LWLRHLFAVLALPVTVTVLVPLWIARRFAVTFDVPASMPGVCALMLGVVALAIGFALFTASLHWFATRGRGTLAPWDPPRRLVVGGPYRYVRNPMISGVIFILAGEALVLRSAPQALWALTFVALNLLFIPLFEEPQLAVRFGDDYTRYRRHVRRFVPRLQPWDPAS
jgi:protein-S-isoprenylcysteine O-methyltransferase Ste14